VQAPTDQKAGGSNPSERATHAEADARTSTRPRMISAALEVMVLVLGMKQ
jgi:hypothetical protein